MGCGSRRVPEPQLPFTWEARAIEGEVRVLEGLAAHEPVVLELGSFVGGELPEPRALVRERRLSEVHQLPQSVGWALPGAVNGALADHWVGDFRSGSWPSGRRERVLSALQRGHGLDRALGDVARAAGGDAVLVSWVDRLQARPLSLDGFPGELVHTPAGSVIIDHGDEPYLVELRAGMALVAADGEVVVRYHQNMATVVSKARSPEAVGRALAADMAAEVAKVWHRPEAPVAVTSAPWAHAAP